ncbi:hypothetical protein B4U79_06214 [Dinothrombium tinctorium]|uniref:Ubiquitin carboxyl-terminal hydrolase n=1 Tax=Dinothrombium tinctorium TaxID=1965070 RepID=A0A443QIS9_9ACAR|nr:hypothetical protein B4U79_06214 [Dinothrombium tinctorium]
MTKNTKKKSRKNYNNKFNRHNKELQPKNRNATASRERKSSSSSVDLFSGFGKVALDDVGSHRQQRQSPTENGEAKQKMENQATLVRPKGLMNWGNTCYANSVFQVLSQTPLLGDLLSDRIQSRKKLRFVNQSFLKNAMKEALSADRSVEKHFFDSDIAVGEKDESEDYQNSENAIEVTLSEPSKITFYLCDFIREMNTNNQCSVITPPNIINATAAKYPQFKGRDQQDSHEFLRCILDAVRTDEIRRQRRAILEGLNIEIKKNHCYDDDTKALVRSFGHASNFTLIDEIFGGFLLCSVKCEECESISQHFEPFFDLSLPVSEEKQKHKIAGRKNKDRDDVADNESADNSNIDLTNEDSSSLSVKDRRSRRIQKKAAKREAKLQRQKEARKRNEVKETTEEEKEIDCSVLVNCKSSKGNCTLKCSSNSIENLECYDSTNCIPSDETNHLTEKVTGGDEADDEENSEEDKCVNQITYELESMNFNEENSLYQPVENNNADNQRIRTTSLNAEEQEHKDKVKYSLLTISPRTVEPGTTSLLSCLASFTSPELLVGANKLICDNCGARYKKKTGIEKKIYSNASKHMTIALPPPVLTLHLKRFEADGYLAVNLRKITRAVSFPLHLDLSPFVSNIYAPICQLLGNSFASFSKQINYSLYGVVEHSGSLRSGHYTAYVKLRNKNERFKTFIRNLPFCARVEEILEEIDSFPNEGEDQTLTDETAKNGRWFHISDSEVMATSVDRVLHAQAYILFYERV